MNISIESLTEKERSESKSLADALDITLNELLQLNFHNENIYDESGIATSVKYVFDDGNASNILSKIKGLSLYDNSIVISASCLKYPV